MPVFEDSSAFRRRRRRSEMPSSHSLGCGTAGIPGDSCSSTTPCIFAALDRASWADVRRAVAADRSLLHSCGSGRYSGPPVHPADYALRLASIWNSLLEHCDRTGVVDPAAVLQDSTLTLRDRVSTIAHVAIWLISAPDAPKPNRDALHVALRSKLASVIIVILQKHPELAVIPAVPSLKTPLHFVASIASGNASSMSSFDPVVVARAILRVPGTSAGCTDAEGRNPLHDLVRSFSVSSNPYGLSLTRSRSHSLHALAPFIELLIAHGADPCARDAAGESPLSLAVRSLDYLAIVQAADCIYESIRSIGQQYKYYGQLDSRMRMLRTSKDYPNNSIRDCTPPGILACLPEDIIVIIMKRSSPRDAVVGLGGACRVLRLISTRENVWRHLSRSCTLEHVRGAIGGETVGV
jgi:hypothetical protein